MNGPDIMGVLNVTPDSFSDGGLFADHETAIRAGRAMAEAGAALVDVGGESTRPGSLPISVEEEIQRTVPVVRALRAEGIKVSIDTRKPQVARASLEAGATFVNDVSGGRDPAMLPLVAEFGAEVCLMHMKGEPRTMQNDPRYEDVVKEVAAYLKERAEAALDHGIPREKIWIDPGIGFGKTAAHNIALLQAIPTFVALGFPVLVGASRKGFLGRILGDEKGPAPMEDREEATLAAHALAQLGGARLIRTHNVPMGVRFAKTLAALHDPKPKT
ncbi:dihydropteroate synthase [soil metagenome]